ncbi:MAG: DUF488 domain-containing protein [Pseudolysinimonas sp.]
MNEVTIKRVYEPPAPDDGYRVLVDRLWPRGVSRDRADLDGWLKDVAPSPQLRTWWNHDPARLSEFAGRYRTELDHNPAVGELEELLVTHPRVTLLYGAHDPLVNHAAVLRDYLSTPPRP